MEKVFSVRTINKMLRSGSIHRVDPKTGYKYSIYATCPTDNFDCPLDSYDKKGGESKAVVRALFVCPICGTRFVPKSRDMFLM
jgi:hypothetical protein